MSNLLVQLNILAMIEATAMLLIFAFGMFVCGYDIVHGKQGFARRIRTIAIQVYGTNAAFFLCMYGVLEVMSWLKRA